ncbi:MAG: NAD(P)H-hydrate dehydratase [Patescibacteria group bacterium]|nr:NAD(P)H-hydrate dehydratase [Patescibacteria group bacterium]
MNEFNINDLKKLYVPASDSHKGQNGKLMVIGGSVLFHAASLWALNIASTIVDMVFYSSVDSNNEIVQKEKQQFRDGIVVPRDKIEHYIDEADAVLIGPGLPREEGIEKGDDDTKLLTENLLQKYKNKKWVVDGGSLQVISPSALPNNSIITPHHQEFQTLFKLPPTFKNAREMAEKYNITILLKGEKDLVANREKSVIIKGGNQGMTKGGTGDVLAGLTASLYCKNEAFLSASSASYINKKAGESLYKTMGLYYNASDLALEIPKVMKKFIL